MIDESVYLELAKKYFKETQDLAKTCKVNELSLTMEKAVKRCQTLLSKDKGEDKKKKDKENHDLELIQLLKNGQIVSEAEVSKISSAPLKEKLSKIVALDKRVYSGHKDECELEFLKFYQSKCEKKS